MSPFELLGVPEDAPPRDVTAAYRRLAKETHPDLNPGDGRARERFSAVRTAYEEILAIRARAAEPDEEAPFPTAWDGSLRRRDVRRVVSISLEMALSGGTVSVPGSSGPCPGCAGEGFLRTRHRVVCHACLGSGISGYGERGIIRVRMMCPECMGSGHATKVMCEECLGHGTSSSVPAEVRIPPGCVEGATFLVEGGANDPEKGLVGDLEVVISIVPHPRFRVQGRDIETEAQIEVWDAALGAGVHVPALSGGGFNLAIPPGTQPGAKFRLKGHGMPGDGGRGDMIVTVAVRIPKAEGAALRAAYEALRRAAQ